MRYDHKGGAVPTVLTVPMNEVSFDDFIVDSVAGWPDGTVGPFFVVIDRGEVTEEKVLCLGRSGTTITPMQRGADNTTSYAHAEGATVEHVFSAVEADDASAHIEATDGVHGVLAGQVIATETMVGEAIEASHPTDYAEQESHVDTPADPSLTTALFGLPYPDAADPLLVRRALQMLAEALDTSIPIIIDGTESPPDPTGYVDGTIYLRREA